MAIDESAGVLSRKDTVLKSAAQSYAMACLMRGPCNPWAAAASVRTMRSLKTRGLVEELPWPEQGPWAKRWHLTDAGRKVAEASPAVREWIEGWETVNR